MKGIERYELTKLCTRLEIDTQEIDSSLTYFENKSHILGLVPSLDRDTLFERQYQRYQAQRERGSYHKGAICPKCGQVGSGIHLKWVLNESKTRYYPYYYFAHSTQALGKYRVSWHYIRKARALEILGDTERLQKYNLKT